MKYEKKQILYEENPEQQKVYKKAIILKNLSQKNNMNKRNNQENLEPKNRI